MAPQTVNPSAVSEGMGLGSPKFLTLFPSIPDRSQASHLWNFFLKILENWANFGGSSIALWKILPQFFPNLYHRGLEKTKLWTKSMRNTMSNSHKAFTGMHKNSFCFVTNSTRGHFQSNMEEELVKLLIFPLAVCPQGGHGCQKNKKNPQNLILLVLGATMKFKSS